MEAAIRNLVSQRVLCCMCGAFSDKWLDVARRCGKEAEPLQVEWGQAINPGAIDQQLATGTFDTVTLIHNETSTGVMNPLPEICCTMAKYPDVALVVDTVSSFSAVPIAMDSLRVDVLLTGVAESARAASRFCALQRFGKNVRARWGDYQSRLLLRLSRIQKNSSSDMTPTTPSIAHINALQSKLDDIFSEGLEARHARHKRTNALVHDWVRARGFEFFAEEGHRSITLTCVNNNRQIDVAKLARDLRAKHHIVIDGGYGKIKGQTFRLSNMGDETAETVSHLLDCLDDCLG